MGLKLGHKITSIDQQYDWALAVNQAPRIPVDPHYVSGDDNFGVSCWTN